MTLWIASPEALNEAARLATRFRVDDPEAVYRKLLDKLREDGTPSTLDFGADPTGSTDSTAALLAFYEHAIEIGRGLIIPGDYKVRRGELILDNGFTDIPWPDIATAGHFATRFMIASSDTTEAPVLTIVNGEPTGGVGRYWRGGSHGGFSIIDTAPDLVATRHGLSLQGITNCRFGYVYSEDLTGSLVYLPEMIPEVGNPDAAAISGTSFAGIESIRGNGYSIENRNYGGMDSVVIDYLRGIENRAGGAYGCGQGCHFKAISLGSCAGRAWDDGTHVDADGGTPNRTVVENTEIDDCEYGIRLNRITFSDFRRVRFNHRWNFGPHNPSGGYWPKRCYEVATGASANIASLKLEAIHRLHVGGTKPDIGSFFYTTSPGSISDVEMDMQVIDADGLVMSDADIATKIIGLNENARVTIRNQGRRIFNSQHSYLAIASHSGSLAIPTSGYGGAGSILGFNSERADFGSAYDPTTFAFTAPYTGRARVRVTIEATIPAGGTLRLGAMTYDGSSYTIVANGSFPANPGEDSETYVVERIISVAAGERIYAAGVCAAGPMNATPSTAASVDDLFEIEML